VVNRLLFLPVVLALSGMPAATVLCDLILCGDDGIPAAARSGCHDHGARRSDAAITSRPAGCAHLPAVDPCVMSESRIGFIPIVVTHLFESAAPTLSVGRVTARASAHAPPGSSNVTTVVPLRN